MTPIRFFTLCGFALLGAGCRRAATFVDPPLSLGAIHFVNAVPDTNAQDIHLIDIASNAGLYNAPFRTSNMFYQGIESGIHHFRIFQDSTDVVVAGTILFDTSLAITQGTNYTFIHTGFLRTAQAPAHDVWMIGDTPPTPAAGQIGVRIIHAGAALGNIDINIQRHPVNAATVDSLPDTPLVANVAYGTVGTYLTLPFDSLTTDSARVVITAAGSKVPIASILLPAGVVGTSTTNPIAGSRIVGSVMTGVIVPPSVGGSHAPQGGAFVNPGVVVLVDRRPPNTAP